MLIACKKFRQYIHRNKSCPAAYIEIQGEYCVGILIALSRIQVINTGLIMNKLNSSTFKSLVGTALLLASTLTHAGIISTSGDVNDINGLDWLDLSFTENKTLTEALSENTAYRAATITEVSAMYSLFDVIGNSDYTFDSVGTNLTRYTRSQDITGFNSAFITAFGVLTTSDGSYNSSQSTYGYVFDDSLILNTFGVYEDDRIPTSTSSDRLISYDSHDHWGPSERSTDGVGWFIVKDRAPDPLPEPSILALMGLGIFGLGFARRRKA